MHSGRVTTSPDLCISPSNIYGFAQSDFAYHSSFSHGLSNVDVFHSNKTQNIQHPSLWLQKCATSIATSFHVARYIRFAFAIHIFPSFHFSSKSFNWTNNWSLEMQWVSKGWAIRVRLPLQRTHCGEGANGNSLIRIISAFFYFPICS